MPDKNLGFLHINPGACGNEGWHKVKTLVQFTLDKGKISDLQIIEIEPWHPVENSGRLTLPRVSARPCSSMDRIEVS